MQCFKQGRAPKQLHSTEVSVPQVLRGSRAPVCSRFKQVSKPSVQTFVAAPQEVRPSEEERQPVPAPQNPGAHNNQLVLTDERAAHKKQPYAWAKQWYPVAVVADMDATKPHAVRMLGGKYVLWCDSKGEWRCQQDRRSVDVGECQLEQYFINVACVTAKKKND
ncbi:hypothetical protein DUNSADRAFT_12171 [Dunaliella salina]|uniref:Rieske domain-containing protein n=1 Tax=Dunaliella salina TaxID=3046 RepID=A0ABQ7GBV2_DUNSA|nr:hypothetical protein DUNSADRAFT_12171 [Dunaliella salina]|eukprot:KAF5832081.1 hypothetical protein DUNSADRAFT_12171 [Dunaliella salina]